VAAGKDFPKDIPPKASQRMSPESLVADLRTAIGDALQSVVLYGSAAAGDFVAGASDYDVLIIARRLDVDTLQKLSSPIRAWIASGNPPPQCFTPEEVNNSCDAFPIEFLDMQQSRKLIYGSDPLAALAIADDHLRLQLERELKGKLHLLRQKGMLVIDRPQELQSLLIASVTTFLVLGRAALRLFQKEVPRQKVAALRDLAKRLSLDIKPILALVEMREQKTAPAMDVAQAKTLFREYLVTLEKLVAAIDVYLHPSHKSGENS
jgi:hypothetical protein